MAIYDSRYTRTQLDEGIGAGYVPTLQAAPTSSTTSYTRSDLPSGSQTVSFVVGQMCRVAVTGGYDFYQLKDVTSGVATWEKVADTNTIPQGYCDTSSSTRDKVVTCTDYTATANSYIMILMKNANSYSTNNSTIRLNINGTGNKTVYINGASSSSSSNKTLPAGSYLVFYDGTNYYFRTDGKITGNITGDAATVNNHKVLSNVPANAVFTDTTYSVMGASGSSHASGLVPDPGSTAGTTKFLREDGTWQIPESGGSVIPVVLLSEPSTPEMGMVMFYADEINKFYQYFRGSWIEISTPHKAIGLGSNDDDAYEIIDGVLSQTPIDFEYNVWYIYYTGGPEYQIGQVVFIGEYGGGVLPTFDDISNWNKPIGLPVGSGTVTSLASLPVTNRMIVATISTNQSTVSINGGVSSLAAGYELHVVVKVTAAVTITLPTSSPYINMNADTTLSLAANTYAEINFISDGTNIYVRSIA